LIVRPIRIDLQADEAYKRALLKAQERGDFDQINKIKENHKETAAAVTDY
jgi:hypothetical protein